MRNPVYLFLLLAAGALASCGASPGGLAGRVSKEVKDKYLKTFNDPASYEVVENQYDSVEYPAYRKLLLVGIRAQEKAIKASKVSIAQSDKSADGIGYYGLAYGMAAAQQLYAEIQQSKDESVKARDEARQQKAGFVRDTVALAKWKLTSKDVYVVHVKHIYRAKNLAGALQRGAFDFDYFPKRDSLVLVANNSAYAEGPTAQ